MTTFWDTRFAEEGYAYGTEPNAYLKQELSKLSPGSILFPAEGQGRNAVYAATLGWQVTAFDLSTEGRKKALQLAEEFGVHIDYVLAGYEDFAAQQESYDCVGLIFTHQPPDQRMAFHQKVISWLRPGGTVLLEGFSKQQLGKASGGPRELAMLFSQEELTGDFKSLQQLEISAEEVALHEGKYHQGPASVIRLKGMK